MKAYLAGPDVFYPNALEIGQKKKEICAEFGIEGLFPLDNELQEPGGTKASLARAIFEANCRSMDEADFGIANMTPFRGPSMDVGTAFEIGYLFAQSKPVIGYANASGSYLSRVSESMGLTLSDMGAEPVDDEGLSIEDFELVDNLMMVCAVNASGVEIISPIEAHAPESNLHTEDLQLALFRRAVEAAKTRSSGGIATAPEPLGSAF